MSEPLLLRTETGGVLEIVLNRPAKLNAINREMWEGIRDAIEDFRARHELRVMLFRANGKYFSAGSDLTDYDGDFDESPMRARDWMRRDLSAGMHRMLVEMERIEKPFVVAHHGMCIGGSLELSLSCDFRLASRSAQYWFPEMQFGMVPLSGGTSRLTRLVGPHWANWMAVANMKVSAERALAIGLIHEIYPDETFESEVRGFCEMLAGHPVEATAVGKMAIQLAADLSSDDARQVERLAFSSLTFAPEYTRLHEKIRARLSKHDADADKE
jgi:enoyl-CoA hydratase